MSQTTTPDNPILAPQGAPRFDEIQPRHVQPAFKHILSWAEEEIQDIENRPDQKQTYWNTAFRISEIRARCRKVYRTVQQMVSAASRPQLQEAFQRARGDYDTFMAGIPLRDGLWQALQHVSENLEDRQLSSEHAWHLEQLLAEFRHEGATLDEQQKERVRQIHRRIGRLETQFEDHLIQATAQGGVHVRQRSRLEGLPDSIIEKGRSRAQERDLEGWWIGLDGPTVQAVLNHGRDRKLRRQVRTQHVQRAWQEPGRDNQPIIEELLELRGELAGLLGYDHFADWRVARRMVGSGQRAEEFQRELHKKIKPALEDEIQQMRQAGRRMGIDQLRAWDISFVRERMREEVLGLEEEQLRPFFPLPQVEQTLFQIASQVFGVQIEEKTGDDRPPVWHDDVRFLEVVDPGGQKVGGFYVDWHPRDNKREGGWMDILHSGGPRPGEGNQQHLGLICGNFREPEDNQPALLNPTEVRTIFHEFGHQLHLLLSKVEVPTRNGPEEIPWDFVEVPSQLMENWMWEREVLEEMAQHWQTEEKLSEEKIQQIQQSRSFLPAWTYHRQIAGGVLDVALHTRCATPESSEDVWTVARQNMEEFALDNRDVEVGRLAGFYHLFQAGYETAYYSYLWSELLEADLFEVFRKQGLFNPQMGQKLVDTILSRGASRPPEDMLEDFLGRKPRQNAWLKRYFDKELDPERQPTR